MNLHMERRMEVLAREIASRKAPKIDAAANAIFDEIGKKHEHKAPSDWSRKKQDAKARTVEDVMSDPTDAERDYIMKLRGGCGCGHPNARPPCRNCETPYDEAEAQEALEETAP